MSDKSELSRAYDIYDPWIAASTERDPYILTLKSGKTVQLLIPTKAAVELEKAGFKIKAGMLDRSGQEFGARWWFGPKVADVDIGAD